MKFGIRPTARADILRQFRFYLLAGVLDTATRFLDAISAMPHLGASKALKTYLFLGCELLQNILIFHVIQPETLRIVRILHGKRDINASDPSIVGVPLK